MSATRSANSGSSIAWPASCSSASPSPAAADRIRSSPPGSPAPSCTGRWSGISPTPTRRSTAPAARSRSRAPEDLGEALIALFANAARLRAMARSAGDTVERRAGAVERSMRALAPLLAGRRSGAVRAPALLGEAAADRCSRARFSRSAGLIGRATARRMRAAGRAGRGADDLRRQFRRRRRRQDADGDRARADAGRERPARRLPVARLWRRERVEPLLVDANAHTAADVGDEPLLLARVAPCWVGRRPGQKRAKRGRSGRERASCSTTACRIPALRQGPRASRVVDGETGFGNGLCVPAGPLRAPVAAQVPLVSRR